jgi:Zn-dependent peptidase ImmA (M78 family)
LRFEGALLTTAERDTGAIVVNKNASPQRQRFTLAHELGHLLNPWHVPHGERQAYNKAISQFRRLVR